MRLEVLVVSDDRRRATPLISCLTELDDPVVHCTPGEAVERLAKNGVGLVLLDFLTERSWVEEILRLAIPTRSPLPTTVALFGIDGQEVDKIEAGYELGAVDVLTDPIVPSVLRAKVRGLLTIERGRRLALREADQLRLLVQGTSDYAIFMLDPQGIIKTWNPGVERLKGYKAEEIIGRPFSVFYPREAIERGWPQYELAMAAEKGRFEDEGWRIRKDGTRFWANVVITALRDSSGRLIGYSKVTRDLTGRRFAEQQLRQSEERVRLLVESVQDYALFMLDPDGRVASWNRGAERIKGYMADEIIGQHFSRFYPEEAVQKGWPEHELKVARAEGRFEDEGWRVRKDGSLFWANVVITALFDDEGVLHGFAKITRDLTERKRSEENERRLLIEQTARQAAEELAASEERLRLALDAGRMGVWDWNIRTGELEWSDSLEPLHGLERGAFGGTFEHFQKLIHPDDRKRVNTVIAAAVEGKAVFDIEYRTIWPDGSIHWTAGKGKVYPGEDGRPARMIGVGMDITHRKRAEQIARFLADASAALSLLVDFDSTLQKIASFAVPHFADWASVDVLDSDGMLRRVAVAHIDREKVQLARDLHRRFPPDPEQRHGTWEILRTGKPELTSIVTAERLEESISNPELLAIVQSLGFKSYIGVPLQVRDRVLGVISFISAESGHHYDETDLAVAEDLASRAAIAIENSHLYRELRDADRRKDEFLATLAHELRNPLAPIRNGLEVLKLSGSENPIANEVHSMMDRQLTQMVRLVDDLLDVSRITRNKLELRKTTTTLEHVIQSAIETSMPVIEQAEHELVVSLPAESVPIQADAVRLAQVFSNLLNNSAKYTEPGGRIDVTATTEGDVVVVHVRDTGLGMPAESLPLIFEMFSQVDRHSERSQGGLGIGLGLVRRLVQMHGGTVEARSEGLGKGSEFVVRLPLAWIAENNHPGEPMAQGHARSQRSRVLIVDDNRDAAMSLATMLRIMGNEATMVDDGLTAVSTAETFRPDVILLDIGLPRLNGYEVCRRIRRQPWSQETLIIALTGWGQSEDRRRSHEAGFDHHLVKPVNVDQLKMLLGRARKASSVNS